MSTENALAPLFVGVVVITVFARPLADWIWRSFWDHFPEEPYNLDSEDGRLGERRAILILAWLLRVIILSGAISVLIQYLPKIGS